ncbi:MAG: acyltransferase, partial [Acidimicrobiia bacterium]
MSTSLDSAPRERPMSVSSSEITRHVRGLDGIRAVSVIGVFAYHLASINAWGQVEPWTAGGFLGVSTFFTLSGYVVVRRLMIEHASASSIGLRHFWTRRTRRLLPASWATLIVTGAIAASVSDYQAMRTHLGETLRAATLGVFNWQQISSGADYAQHFAGTASPFRHFWSLAVEEQSYVVIAVLAFLVLRGPRGQGNFRVAMVVLTVGSAWAMFRFGSYSTRAYMGTDTRFAEISVGALGALSRPWTRKSSFLNSCAWVACVAMVLMWVRTPLESPWLYRGGLIGLAVLAVIICTSLDSQRPPSRLVSILDWAPIAWLGRVSYGVYLIHWPVLLFTRAPHFGDVPDWARGALQIALTLALAAISYRYLEQPIRNVRVLRPPRFLIAVVVVLVTLMASSVTVFEDRPSALETAIADRDHVVDPRTSTGSTSTPSQGRPSLREPRV